MLAGDRPRSANPKTDHKPISRRNKNTPNFEGVFIYSSSISFEPITLLLLLNIQNTKLKNNYAALKIEEQNHTNNRKTNTNPK